MSDSRKDGAPQKSSTPIDEALSLSDEDRALIGSVVPAPLRVFFTGVRVNEATKALLDAARDEGRRSPPIGQGVGGEPVAWRVKDYADGWVYCVDKHSAEVVSRQNSNALIQPLYSAAPAPPVVDREVIERLTERVERRISRLEQEAKDLRYALDVRQALQSTATVEVGVDDLLSALAALNQGGETARDHERSGAHPDVLEALQDCWGALNFILAFYEPGQRYLDTNAWKEAEASGRRAHKRARETLDALVSPSPDHDGIGRKKGVGSE